MEKKLNLEDCNCSICFKFMVEPVGLQCSHFFCFECLKSLVKKGNFKCPMCREAGGEVKLEINQEMVDLMVKQYPEEYKQAEIALQELRLQQNQKLEVKCWVANEVNSVQGEEGKNYYSVFIRHHTDEKANPICLFKSIKFTLADPYTLKDLPLEFPFHMTQEFKEDKDFEATFTIEFEDWMKAEKMTVTHLIKRDLKEKERHYTPFVVLVPRINYERFMDFIKDKIDPNYPDLV
jgi:hypothetical protein